MADCCESLAHYEQEALMDLSVQRFVHGWNATGSDAKLPKYSLRRR
jgi:hypothetical protein